MPENLDELIKDIQDSMNNVLATERQRVRLRYGFAGGITADQVGSDVLNDVAIDLLKTNLNREFCRRGYFERFTCEESSVPGEINFLVSYEGRRMKVGLSIDF